MNKELIITIVEALIIYDFISSVALASIKKIKSALFIILEDSDFKKTKFGRKLINWLK